MITSNDEKIVDKILSNLSGRSGIGNMLDEIDDEVMKEIRDSLIEIVINEKGEASNDLAECIDRAKGLAVVIKNNHLDVYRVIMELIGWAVENANNCESLDSQIRGLENLRNFQQRLPVDTGNCGDCNNLIGKNGCRTGNDTGRASCCFHTRAGDNDIFKRMENKIIQAEIDLEKVTKERDDLLKKIKIED